MKTATVMSSPMLVELTHLARLAGRNRYPDDAVLQDLDPEGAHLLMFSMLHNDVEIRTGWYIKLRDREEPFGPIFLDMSFEDFQSLPSLELEPLGA